MDAEKIQPKDIQHLERGHHRGMWQQHRRGILRTWVFSVLLKKPSNGAEIMNQIESSSPGNWRPSPGSMYPLLDQLCKEQCILKREDGRYEITERGKKELQWPFEVHSKQPIFADEAIDKLESNIAVLEDLKHTNPSTFTQNRDKLKASRDRLTALIDTQ